MTSLEKTKADIVEFVINSTSSTAKLLGGLMARLADEIQAAPLAAELDQLRHDNAGLVTKVDQLNSLLNDQAAIINGLRDALRIDPSSPSTELVTLAKSMVDKLDALQANSKNIA